MKVLHFFHAIRTDLGGPPRAIVDLCGALAGRGHEVTLATADARDVPPAWSLGTAATAGAPHVRVIPAGRFDGKILTPSAASALREEVRVHDVLHLHGPWEIANAQAASIARTLQTPYVVSIRGMLDDWSMESGRSKKRLYLALLGRRMLERASAVHLTARFEHAQARKHFPRGRGVVIPNLLDLAPFERLPGPASARARFPALTSGRANLLFLSRIHVKKGLESLFRAAAMLRRKGIDVNVLVAGTGEPAYVGSVKALAAELGLAERAAFLGQVVGEEKLSLYQACDLFVLPTSQENFGFVFAESLACGTPVVTTRGVDIWPELEGSGGAVIAEGTTEATASAVESMLSDRARLREMGERGRAWVFDALNPQRVIREFESMYEEAVKGRGAMADERRGAL
jgi:glycosyltransferase involved in cell wall biosynthesis